MSDDCGNWLMGVDDTGCHCGRVLGSSLNGLGEPHATILGKRVRQHWPPGQCCQGRGMSIAFMTVLVLWPFNLCSLGHGPLGQCLLAGPTKSQSL